MDSTLYGKLLTSALRYLSYRPRSIYETRDYLSGKLKTWQENDDGIVDKVLSNLQEMGYLDDTKFALWLAESRKRNKPRGDKLIKYELQKKGISHDVIEESLKTTETPGDDELTRARNAVRNVSEVWSNLAPADYRRKLYGFLLRRGFSIETAAKIIDESQENR